MRVVPSENPVSVPPEKLIRCLSRRSDPLMRANHRVKMRMIAQHRLGVMATGLESAWESAVRARSVCEGEGKISESTWLQAAVRS